MILTIAQEEIERHGLSVRRNNIGIGQAIDLAGEQTYSIGICSLLQGGSYG